MTEAHDARFVAIAAPVLTIATLALRSRGRTGMMRTPQLELLSRCGPWAMPALAGWMATAAGLTIIRPLLLTQRGADEEAARPMVQPIASLMAVQIVLETALGALSDKALPLSGMTFSLYRLHQLRRALDVATHDQTPRAQRGLRLQRWFWRTNVLMLLVTVVVRTKMRPYR